MNLRIILTALHLSCALLVCGQGTFFNFEGGWFMNFSTEQDNSYLLLGLRTINQNPSNHAFQYDEISSSGESLDEFYYFVDSVPTTTTYKMSQMAVRVDEYVYRAAIIGFPNILRAYGGLFKYNMQTQETELIHVYDQDLNNQMYSVAYKNDSSLLIGGLISNNIGTTSLVLHETDLEGEPRWTYSTSCGSFCYNYPEHILPLENGNTALLYREWSNASSPWGDDREQAVLVLIDPQGQELWRAYPGNGADYKILPGGILEQDGELLVCYTDPYLYQSNGDWFPNFESSVFFKRYDMDGGPTASSDLVGQIPNGFAPDFAILLYDMTQMQRLDDGNILVSGFSGIHGTLIKVNPLGELIWYKEYTPYPQPNSSQFFQSTRIYHTLQTSDGGFLCTGEYRSDPRPEYPNGLQTAFALKLDRHGCLEPGCEVSALSEYEVGMLQVWPNPIQGTELNVQLPQGLIAQSLLLVDALGREVEFVIPEQGEGVLRVSLESLPAGLYTLLVTGRDGELFSEKVVVE